MSDADAWKQERFLITLLSILGHDARSRLEHFITAGEAGGGKNRNRRRPATGREALKDLHASEQVSVFLAPLKAAIDERIAEVTSPGIEWLRRTPLLPGFAVEEVLAALQLA